jgi:hypothetical protein
MKSKKILDSTTNSMIYKRVLKFHRESRGQICCSRCPYHDGENGYYHNHRDYRNWKRYRKTQYKVKNEIKYSF